MRAPAANTGVVNIRGREYTTVAVRVQRFRELHPDMTLLTEIIHRDVDCVVMRASISTPEGRIVATGHAEEYRKASEINRTSALENCETSAIGRCLATFGLGGTEFASADEVARAVSGAKASATDAGGTISPTAEAWKLMNPEQQDYLRRLAAKITQVMPDAAAALEVIESTDLDADHKAALWFLLDSGTRAAIKKQATTTKEAA